MAEAAHVAQLRRWRETMIAYLTLKLEQHDWHGVADAAMDLRELEAELLAVDPHGLKERSA